jgi:hypothetical protein
MANGENNDFSLDTELMGVHRDILQHQILVMAGIIAQLSWTPLGICYGCSELGVVTRRGKRLAAHVAGCRVAAALQGK